MKYTLVTGGAGFIGTNLCIKLQEMGKQVIAVDNFITSTGQNLASISNPNFIFVKHDITKPFPSRIKNQELRIKEIYHLACPTGVPNVTRHSEEMIRTCSVGTINVMELAKEKGAKVLFTSSSEAYGDPEVFPQDERYTGNVHPTGVRSPYEEGKRFSESIVIMYVRKYKADAKIVRIFNTYGPHMSLKDSRVIPNFIKQILNHTPLTVQGDGTQKRTFCYVDDLVEGLMIVMDKGTSGEAYNLGSDQEIQIKDLAVLILKLADAKNTTEFVKRPKHDHQGRRPSLEKASKIGWKEKINLEDGLRRALAWYGL